MAFVSPLRYPGGKGKLANYIKLVLRYNDLLDGHYVEPYAGGSAVAISLLFSEHVSKIHINDISRPIFAFWYSVLYLTDDLCKLIQDTDVNIKEWHKQKEIQNNLNDVSLLTLGFSTFFLNRTNRSGIIKGGVIGGKNQKGTYKLDARFNKKELIKRVEKIARYKDRISLYNEDAELFVTTKLNQLPKKTFIYFDPPYFTKGKGLYEDYYKHQDHIKISRILTLLGRKWIITYDNTEEIRDIYLGYRFITYSLNYSTAIHRTGEEIMFFSENLIIPPINSPANISLNMFNEFVQASR